jgi:hypothetical protein
MSPNKKEFRKSFVKKKKQKQKNKTKGKKNDLELKLFNKIYKYKKCPT